MSAQPLNHEAAHVLEKTDNLKKNKKQKLLKQSYVCGSLFTLHDTIGNLNYQWVDCDKNVKRLWNKMGMGERGSEGGERETEREREREREERYVREREERERKEICERERREREKRYVRERERERKRERERRELSREKGDSN